MHYARRAQHHRARGMGAVVASAHAHTESSVLRSFPSMSSIMRPVFTTCPEPMAMLSSCDRLRLPARLREDVCARRANRVRHTTT